MCHPQVLPSPCQSWQCQPAQALLQSQLKNEVGRGNMVLSRGRAREGGFAMGI